MERGIMGHSYRNAPEHIVFSTKHRRPVIRPEFRLRLYEYMAGVARKEFGMALKIGGTENHIHGLLQVMPEVSLAEALRKWKCLSSKWVHEVLRVKDFAWQIGYASIGVSPDRIKAVTNYITNQERHHHRRTFEEEFTSILTKAGIPFDPRHVFD